MKGQSPAHHVGGALGFGPLHDWFIWQTVWLSDLPQTQVKLNGTQTCTSYTICRSTQNHNSPHPHHVSRNSKRAHRNALLQYTVCHTCTDDLLNLDSGDINLFGKFSHCLVRVLISEGVNVDLHSWWAWEVGRAAQWGGAVRHVGSQREF